MVPLGLLPLTALEDAIRPALLRPPCVVSFSGGRDSSAVLAVATRLARREGMALPLPVTWRFADVKGTQESDWQDLVIRHLGLTKWVKLELTDELDFLGAISTDVLRRHGLLWPSNGYAHVLILREAPGGSLLTGFDGDSVLGCWRYAALTQLGRNRSRPRRETLRAIAARPRPLRSLVLRGPVERQISWLTWLAPSADRTFRERYLADELGEPARWDRLMTRLANRRYVQLATSALATLGADVDAQVHHPLLAPRFLASLAALGGKAGLGDRTAAMSALFGDLLPTTLLERRTKAVFDGAFWRSGSKHFAHTWDRTGVEESPVDPDALQPIWAAEKPLFPTSLLLQQAWLSAEAGENR